MIVRTPRLRTAALAAAAALLLALPGCFAAEEDGETGDVTGDITGDETGDITGDETGDAGTPSFTTLYDGYLVDCATCHALDPATGDVIGPGATDDIEGTLDFTDRDTAYASLQGSASGLVGNQEACNDVAFIGATSETSMLMAVLDEDVRLAFDAGTAGCDSDALTDMALRVGYDPGAAYLADLAAWIDAGAPDN